MRRVLRPTPSRWRWGRASFRENESVQGRMLGLGRRPATADNRHEVRIRAEVRAQFRRAGLVEHHDAAQIPARLEVSIAEIDLVEAIAARDQFAQLQLAAAGHRVLTDTTA